MKKKRTPAHKRATRAERGRDEWKMKAIERREEAEKWKAAATRKTDRVKELLQKQKQLESELMQSKHTIQDLENELDEKKNLRSWEKAI